MMKFICFLFWHRYVDIGATRTATGKPVLMCMRCGLLVDVEKPQR